MNRLVEGFTSNIILMSHKFTSDDPKITLGVEGYESEVNYQTLFQVMMNNGKPTILVIPVTLLVKEQQSISDFQENVELSAAYVLSGSRPVPLSNEQKTELSTFLSGEGRTTVRLQYDDLMEIERIFAQVLLNHKMAEAYSTVE